MKLEIPYKIAMEGVFIAEVSGGERGTVVLNESGNLILNAGIARLLSQGSNVLQYISVGTGNSTPTPGQTVLDSRIATTSRNSSNSYGYTPIESALVAFGQTIFSVQFDRGQAAGNLSEVGVGWQSDGTGLWSRALFRDVLGNPTTITIKSDEFLRLTYVLKRYVPEVWSGTLTYDDDGTPATTMVTISPGTNTSVTGLGSGGNVRTWGTSSNSTFRFGSNPAFNQLNWSILFDLEQGNPGISSLQVPSTVSSPQLIPAGTTITFSPPITKTNEFEITINFRLTVSNGVP